MGNVIASATTVSNGTIKRNNFLIGVNTSVEYAPTSATTFWSGIIPPSSGYTIYEQKSVNGPSIKTPSNDSQLITIANQCGGTNITTISGALSYFNDQSNYMVANIDYPNIVTSGLTLMLDAGYIPSYPRTGTTWNDLSGNVNNGTLTNGSLFNSTNGGYILFNGNSVSFSTYSQPAYTTGTSFSWNVWVYPLSNNNSPIMGNRGVDLIFTKLTSNAFEYYNLIISAVMTLNVWQNICVIKDNTNFYYYKNSSLTVSTTYSTTKISKPFFVGGDPSANEYTNSRIAQVSVYNRALSADEVLQNYNALKSRFGL